MYFITLIKMLMITEGVRCGVPAVLARVWCIIGAHPPGRGRGWCRAEEVTQHSAVDTKATVTPHQTRLWCAIYYLFIANLYLRYAHLIMPTF